MKKISLAVAIALIVFATCADAAPVKKHKAETPSAPVAEAPAPAASPVAPVTNTAPPHVSQMSYTVTKEPTKDKDGEIINVFILREDGGMDIGANAKVLCEKQEYPKDIPANQRQQLMSAFQYKVLAMRVVECSQEQIAAEFTSFNDFLAAK